MIVGLYPTRARFSRIQGLAKSDKEVDYAAKFDKCQSDKKKTWKIINELRGKDKSGIKPSFVIGNERIICMRIIANKFNDYFAMLASNLNMMKLTRKYLLLHFHPSIHTYQG